MQNMKGLKGRKKWTVYSSLVTTCCSMELTQWSQCIYFGRKVGFLPVLEDEDLVRESSKIILTGHLIRDLKCRLITCFIWEYTFSPWFNCPSSGGTIESSMNGACIILLQLHYSYSPWHATKSQWVLSFCSFMMWVMLFCLLGDSTVQRT